MRDRRLRAQTLIEAQKERTPHGFIGGLDLRSEGSQTIEVFEAANNQSLGRCPLAHPQDIEKAIEAARTASLNLRERRPEKRARDLESLADIFETHQEDLALLECLQTGRSYRDVLRNDVELGLRTLRYAAAYARHPIGEVHDLGRDRVGYVYPTPRPVHATLLPASEPLGASIRRTAMTLAAGSSLILFAPPEAPLAVLRFAALSRDLNIPPGALNVLTSDGVETPQRVAESSIDAISFSGPQDIARRVLVGAAKSNLKPVSLELECKTPCFVLPDADLSLAIEAIWRSSVTSFCQLNRSIGRILVHGSIYAEVADRLTHVVRATHLGHPLDEHTELGPLVSESMLKKTLAYVELGHREGGVLVAGGSRDVEGQRYTGNYVQPTLFLDPPPDGRLVREPIPGPVISLERFMDEQEAVRRVQASLGHTGAVIFSQDIHHAEKLAARLPVGQVWINESIELFPFLPHAAAGEVAEPTSGLAGIDACGYLKTVMIGRRSI